MDILAYIANMDVKVYIRMYLLCEEFRKYATTKYAIDDFIERFVVKRMNDHIHYKLGNIEYYKYDDGSQLWCMNGKIHRDDGPALICANGEKRWYLNGGIHSDNGPAMICNNGDMFWYKNGRYHRDNGPSVIRIDGYKAYYLNDKKHRLDGPAIIHVDGSKEYWMSGVRIK
jgi:hypothetical protein